jgi:hypothetical protein
MSSPFAELSINLKRIRQNRGTIKGNPHAISTEAPECANIPLKGGYTVQPVPTPDSTKLDNINKDKDGGNNQKLKLFNRAKAISGAPNIIGTNQLPKPPINTGITIKK